MLTSGIGLIYNQLMVTQVIGTALLGGFIVPSLGWVALFGVAAAMGLIFNNQKVKMPLSFLAGVAAVWATLWAFLQYVAPALNFTESITGAALGNFGISIMLFYAAFAVINALFNFVFQVIKSNTVDLTTWIKKRFYSDRDQIFDKEFQHYAKNDIGGFAYNLSYHFIALTIVSIFLFFTTEAVASVTIFLSLSGAAFWYINRFAGDLAKSLFTYSVGYTPHLIKAVIPAALWPVLVVADLGRLAVMLILAVPTLLIDGIRSLIQRKWDTPLTNWVIAPFITEDSVTKRVNTLHEKFFTDGLRALAPDLDIDQFEALEPVAKGPKTFLPLLYRVPLAWAITFGILAGICVLFPAVIPAGVTLSLALKVVALIASVPALIVSLTQSAQNKRVRLPEENIQISVNEKRETVITKTPRTIFQNLKEAGLGGLLIGLGAALVVGIAVALPFTIVALFGGIGLTATLISVASILALGFFVELVRTKDLLKALTVVEGALLVVGAPLILAYILGLSWPLVIGVVASAAAIAFSFGFVRSRLIAHWLREETELPGDIPAQRVMEATNVIPSEGRTDVAVVVMNDNKDEVYLVYGQMISTLRHNLKLIQLTDEEIAAGRPWDVRTGKGYYAFDPNDHLGLRMGFDTNGLNKSPEPGADTVPAEEEIKVILQNLELILLLYF